MDNNTELARPESAYVSMTNKLRQFNHFLYLYVSPVLFIGVIGNAVAFYCLLKKGRSLHKHLIPMFIIVVADGGTLMSTLMLDRFMNKGLQIPAINLRGTFVCKFMRYFWGVFNFLSVNTIGILAVDTWAALKYPLFYRQYDKRNMIRFCGGYLILALVINVILSVKFELILGGRMSCYIAPGTTFLETFLLQMFITLFVNGVFSAVMVSVLNLLIVCRLLKRNDLEPIGLRERKASINLIIMALTFLCASSPRCFAYVIATIEIYVFADLEEASFFREIAIMLDFPFYCYCAVSWIVYVVRFKLWSTSRVAVQ